MTKRILGNIFAASSLLLLAIGAQATMIQSIDMEVRGDNFEANTPADTSLQDLIDDFNQGNLVCDVSLDALDMVGSVQTCSGPNQNIATWFTLEVSQDANTYWQFGSDFGGGAAGYVIGSPSYITFASEQDHWWAESWNNGDVIDFTTYGAGTFTLNLFGFEGCCGGAMSLRYREQGADGWQIASVTVPEPSTLALLGIGLLGMGLVGRRRKI